MRFAGVGSKSERCVESCLCLRRNPAPIGWNCGKRLTTSSHCSWLFRVTLAGRTREMGLGPLHTVSLAEARERARECRKLYDEGKNSIEKRNAEGHADEARRRHGDDVRRVR